MIQIGAAFLAGLCVARAWQLHRLNVLITFPWMRGGRDLADLPEQVQTVISRRFWEAVAFKVLAVWAGWLWWTA